MIGINNYMKKEFLPTYLYIKTHNLTGLKYFGKTTNDPYNYYGSGKYWLAHLRKHGYDISTEIVGYYINKDECVKVATTFSTENNIVLAVTDNNKKIWANQIVENGLDGGAVRFGPHSIETKRKISEAHKGMIVTEDTKEKIRKARATQINIGMRGKKQSAETKQKLRDANLGKKQSAETIAKRSKKLKGHIVTDATRQKIANANTGKVRSEETRQKMRNKVVSEEQKQHLREINLGKKASAETKQKLSGKIVVIDKQGNLLRIDSDLYYSQLGPKSDWEWVSHKSTEAKMRRG